jgi:hypothetical protein
MEKPEYLELWTKIQHFRIDDETAATRFSDKLATEQVWTSAFTKRAIEEYKKFILLCCISGTGAAPSKIVDEVWHLHLTYTQSYWTDFCKNTLGKDIHHFPSPGGETEDQRHREWYAATLMLYKDIFGKEAPADIWPDPVMQGVKLELPPRGFRMEVILGIAAILISPFLFIYFSYGTVFPFLLNGPQFLQFFPLYSAALMLSYILYRYLDNKMVTQIAAANFPEDVTPFQVAFFLYGKHRAFQTSVVDMVKKGLLEVTEDQHLIIRNHQYEAKPDDPNPLITTLSTEQDGTVYNYKDLLEKWMDQKKFSHPVLNALEKYAFGRRGALRDYAFQAAFGAVFLIRIAQGISNRHPVAFLVLEFVMLLIIFLFVVRLHSRRAMVCKIIDGLYLDRLKQPDPRTDLVIGEFALAGIPAIGGFAEGVLLSGMFGFYPSRGYRTGWVGGYGIYGGYGGGGGCSGGGGCGGGGGGCGGGGCGG